jgi:hypothetical protein
MPAGRGIREFDRTASQRSVSDCSIRGCGSRRVIIIVAPSAGASPDVLAGKPQHLASTWAFGPPKSDLVLPRLTSRH